MRSHSDELVESWWKSGTSSDDSGNVVYNDSLFWFPPSASRSSYNFFSPFRVPKSFLSVKCIERKSWKQHRFSLERNSNSPIGPFDPQLRKEQRLPVVVDLYYNIGTFFLYQPDRIESWKKLCWRDDNKFLFFFLIFYFYFYFPFCFLFVDWSGDSGSIQS